MIIVRDKKSYRKIGQKSLQIVPERFKVMEFIRMGVK
jgi:hypothetical protein